ITSKTSIANLNQMCIRDRCDTAGLDKPCLLYTSPSSFICSFILIDVCFNDQNFLHCLLAPLFQLLHHSKNCLLYTSRCV
ncbi:hypothetical protein A5856_001767, partial [Enterococcus faecium]